MRCRTRSIVRTLTRTASAIRVSVQSGPPSDASACSSTRACASLRASAPPREIIGLPPVEWRGEIRASCGCTHGDPFHAGPRLGRGAIADGRMQTLPIVEDFDVFEHGRLRLLAGAEADLVDVSAMLKCHPARKVEMTPRWRSAASRYLL